MLTDLRKLRSLFAPPMLALFALALAAGSEGVPMHDGMDADAHVVEAHAAHDGHGDHGAHPGAGAPSGDTGDHLGHGCDGCACVALAGCSAPALPSRVARTSVPPPVPSTLEARAAPGALAPPGHDVFRPPRS